MTDGIMGAIEEWTGDRPMSCPWRAFFDPFVRRILALYGFFESGQLSWYLPEPSNREAAGIAHYHRVRSLVTSKGMAQEAEKRRKRG
jgi:hypothetical protein